MKLLLRWLVALLISLPVGGGAVVVGSQAPRLCPGCFGSALAGEVVPPPVQLGAAGTGDPELDAALVQTARAAADAKNQAGFAALSAEQLAVGTGQLGDGATELMAGVAQLDAGAQQLRQGLIELQAGTGQLGYGATEIADGVATAVEQFQGVTVLQTQVLVALEEADQHLATQQDPELKKLRPRLQQIREELRRAGIDGELGDKLDKLRSGTRDLANQLAVSGYGYHDGIYSATNGAAELAAGTSELAAAAQEATDGIQQLVDGAAKVAEQTAATKEKTGQVLRTLPQLPASADPAAGAASETSAQPAPAQRAWPLGGAIAVLVLLGSFLLSLRPDPRRVGGVILLAVGGFLLLSGVSAVVAFLPGCA